VANSAIAAAPPGPGNQAGSPGGMGGVNPFQIATNLYAEKNLQGAIQNLLLSANTVQGGGAINAGQYLRALRLMQRTVVAGVAGTAVSPDGAFSNFANLDLVNVDGSEILYNMSGFSHYLAHKYFRPWLRDPACAYDYQPPSATSAGSCTLSLQPEVRFTAGVLANTDTRSQYRFDMTIATASAVGGAYTTAPTISVIPYMDAWAQPDGNDLQGTPNQPVPPGVNLQVKRRHQIFTLNAAGSDNVLLSTLTGNALRGMLLVTRNSANARVDGFTDPIYWQLDNRSLGRLNPDMVRQWYEDFYNEYNRGGDSTIAAPLSTANNAVDGLSGVGLYAGAGAGDTGVYAFPRFINPGDLTGQGWLYTANNTKLQWESSTSAAAGANATCELITDEVYPVGPVDPTLIDI
jgi:hypothetical protein